jgi:hypothetical protein
VQLRDDGFIELGQRFIFKEAALKLAGEQTASVFDIGCSYCFVQRRVSDRARSASCARTLRGTPRRPSVAGDAAQARTVGT